MGKLIFFRQKEVAKPAIKKTAWEIVTEYDQKIKERHQQRDFKEKVQAELLACGAEGERII